MAKIPNTAIPNVYHISKRVFHKEISLKEGKELIVAAGVENPGSAPGFIYCFRYLLEGKSFPRKMNAFSMEYFFEHIQKDYGQAGLKKAIKALEGHIDYHKQRSTNLRSMSKIVAKYKLQLNYNQDELEQLEIAETIKDSWEKRAEIINYLMNLKPSDSEWIKINGKSYKRDNKTIAFIKELRGFKCQICSTQILKANGKFYIEAAHISPKNRKGPETPDNILILCPNHHKEFDYGNREIIAHSKHQIIFKLNGKKYDLSLKIE